MARTRKAKQGGPAVLWQAVGFFGSPGLDYGTSDGGRLRFASDERVVGGLRLRNETEHGKQVSSEEDEEAGIGTDILSAELRVADAEGRFWVASSRFDAGLLVSQMIDVARISNMPYRDEKRKGNARVADRPTLALADVRFWSDDRFIRPLAIYVPEGKDVETRVVEMQFKYTLLSFDLSYHRPFGDDDLGHSLEVQARLSEGCAFDYESVEDIGPLVFSFDWEHLFRHNQWSRDGEGTWRCSTLPLPLVFRPDEGTGTPQPHVIVSGGGASPGSAA